MIERARGFLVADPDPHTKRELEAIITRAESGDEKARLDLEDRFRGPLEFGTAGLRGIIGAGESRMNRAVVMRVTYGLIATVLREIPGAKERGIVIGRDGRRLSEELQADAAEVALALGVRVHFLPGVTPTPVTAFAVKELGAAAGVMVTASHNPPAYNGYKVYWDNGAQIIPPNDALIAGAFAAAPPAIDVPRMPIEEGRRRGLLSEVSVTGAYLDRLDRLCFAATAPVGELKIAYSALHGVGESTFRAAAKRRGFTRLFSVEEQAEPDGAFPTVAFPNPEEPGALDLVLALAKREAADVVLVNDPDADRLGAAVRRRNADGTSDYVTLNGNEIGVLLAHHVLVRDVDQSPDRLVMATIVSSQLLRRMAEKLGVRYEETLTGFKWIANTAIERERTDGARFVFGYEEALGYTTGSVVRDKDGISAAIVLAELAASLKAEGRTLLDELETIRRRYGFMQSRQRSITLPGRDGEAQIRRAMSKVRSDPPQTLAGARVLSAWDLLAKKRIHAGGRVEDMARWSGDVVILELEEGGRIAIRPSGTEPKIKLYFEIAEPLGEGGSIAEAAARGRARLDGLERALIVHVGL